MSNTFALDDLREAVERDFAPVVIEVGEDKITLRNLMRLPKLKRDEAVKLLNDFKALVTGEETAEDDGEDATLATAHAILELVADANGDKLVAALGDDIALTVRVLETWMEATQPGEAQNSPA